MPALPGNALSKPQLRGRVYFSYLCHGYKRILSVVMGLGNNYSVIHQQGSFVLSVTLAAHTRQRHSTQSLYCAVSTSSNPMLSPASTEKAKVCGRHLLTTVGASQLDIKLKVAFNCSSPSVDQDHGGGKHYLSM